MTAEELVAEKARIRAKLCKKVQLSQKDAPTLEDDPSPAVLIGKPNGARMERGEINDALAAARDVGFFGASEAMSGKGIKFLFFPDDGSPKSVDEQEADFVSQVQEVQKRTGLTGWADYDNVSTLDEAKKYWRNANGIDLRSEIGSSGLQGSSEGPLDIFRGSVDALLAPYIAALRVEGFSRVNERFAEKYGWCQPTIRKSARDTGRPSDRPRASDSTTVRKAIHYGRQPNLRVLSGHSNGTGIKGAEDQRLKESTDPRIKQRVYFYTPVDGGIPQPEVGLGGAAFEKFNTSAGSLEFKSFTSDGNLVSNSWLEEPNGESYRSRISESGRSDLLGWVRDFLAPRVQSVFEEYSEKYSWGDPGRIQFSQKDTGGPSDRRSPGDGATVRQAVHYGKVAGLNQLSGHSNRTGIKGAEDQRLKESTDRRI